MAQKLRQTQRFVERRVAIARQRGIALQGRVPGGPGSCSTNLRSNGLFLRGPPVANLRLLPQQGCFISQGILRVSTRRLPVPE